MSNNNSMNTAIPATSVEEAIDARGIPTAKFTSFLREKYPHFDINGANMEGDINKIITHFKTLQIKKNKSKKNTSGSKKNTSGSKKANTRKSNTRTNSQRLMNYVEKKKLNTSITLEAAMERMKLDNMNPQQREKYDREHESLEEKLLDINRKKIAAQRFIKEGKGYLTNTKGNQYNYTQQLEKLNHSIGYLM